MNGCCSTPRVDPRRGAPRPRPASPALAHARRLLSAAIWTWTLCSLGKAPAAEPSLRVRTTAGESFAVTRLSFTTPRDLDSIGPNDRVADLHTDPPLLFSSLHAILLHDLPVITLGSRPEALESYQLGTNARPIPPPPNWRRASGQVPPWRYCSPTSDTRRLPYLADAAYAWAPRLEALPLGETPVFLFRQSLAVDDQLGLARATLRIGTNARLIEAALNEAPLEVAAGEARTGFFEFEVTPLVRAGANGVALKLAADTPGREYALAFHLELLRRAPQAPVPPPDPEAALLRHENGARTWGRLRAIGGGAVEWMTPHGLLTYPQATLQAMLFPRGWAPAPAPRGWFAGAAPRPAGTPPRPLHGLSTLPTQGDRVLLADGRHATGRIAALGPETFTLQGETATKRPTGELLAAWQELTPQTPYETPDRTAAELTCIAQTLTGERWVGYARGFNARRLLLEPPGGEPLVLPTAQLAALEFPWHGMLLTRALPREQRIGLLPGLPGQTRLLELARQYERTAQRAVAALGLPLAALALDELADPARLTPQRYPVLLLLDPAGEYLATLEQDGDAEQALANYVRGGGQLLALSRAGAFRTAVKRGRGGAFARGVAEPGLAGALGLRLLRPAEGAEPAVESSSEAVAFDYPPASADALYFEKQGTATGPLRLLPERLDLHVLPQPTFHPLLAPAGSQRLYVLRTTTGAELGPGLTLAAAGRGRVLLIDHLLWQARRDDAPFGDRLLPILLAATLQTTP